MLISAVADLGRLAPDQRRNPDPVVVDEQEILAPDQDVPVLQIAVGELRGLDVLDQRPELLPERRELLGLVQQALHEPIQIRALDPGHLHDRKCATFDAEAVGQIEELGAVRGAVLSQMLGDGRVALGMIGDRAEKAPDRPDVLTLGGLVHDGVPARGGLRHAEAVLFDLGPLQLGIAEGALRVLKGFMVLGEVRPGGHCASPRLSPRWPAG